MKKSVKNFFMVLITVILATFIIWTFRIKTDNAEALFERVETSEGVEWYEKDMEGNN